MVFDHFDDGLGPHWSPFLAGVGRLEPGESLVRLVVDGATERRYSDAQIDDYQGLSRRRFPWRPPLRLSARGRASHPAAGYQGAHQEQSHLMGTAGFGFWNNPFIPSGGVPTLPESAWFFYASPPSNMALVPGVPGHGWKAAVVHAARPGALALGPLVVAAMLWGRLRRAPGLAASLLQRLTGAQEAVLDPDQADLASWHTYEIDWLPREALFRVDGAQVLRAPSPPRGPLGFVAWVDNQYTVVTPWGALRFGLLAVPGRQWLELDWVSIQPIGC